MKNFGAMIESIKREGNCDLITEAIPYLEFLGISASVVDGELIGKLSYHDALIGNHTIPALHGGTLGALLECTAVFQILFEAETVVLPKVINITIDYLRTGRAKDVYAHATITRHGRRIANVRAEAWQDDRSRPIAAAHAHFLIVPRGDEE